MDQEPERIENLLARVALRDRNAFQSLYDAVSTKLFGVCLRLLKDRQEAEDALQEVFIKIWHGAATRGPGHSPHGWMVIIARNHAIDRLRARRPKSEDIDERHDLADRNMNPEEIAENTSQRRRIDICMEELEADRAEAVRGAYVEGYSYEELADRYKVPVNTMRTWLRRSLIKLKECLER